MPKVQVVIERDELKELLGKEGDEDMEVKAEVDDEGNLLKLKLVSEISESKEGPLNTMIG